MELRRQGHHTLLLCNPPAHHRVFRLDVQYHHDPPTADQVAGKVTITRSAREHHPCWHTRRSIGVPKPLIGAAGIRAASPDDDLEGLLFRRSGSLALRRAVGFPRPFPSLFGRFYFHPSAGVPGPVSAAPVPTLALKTILNALTCIVLLADLNVLPVLGVDLLLVVCGFVTFELPFLSSGSLRLFRSCLSLGRFTRRARCRLGPVEPFASNNVPGMIASLDQNSKSCVEAKKTGAALVYPSCGLASRSRLTLSMCALLMRTSAR